MHSFRTLASIATFNAILLITQPVDAQQISPNPNPSGNTIYVNPGQFNDENFINDGVLNLNTGASLINNEYLRNNGLVYNDNLFDNRGQVDNFGTLSSRWTMLNSGLINNHGAMRASDDIGTLTNDGIIYNYNYLDNDWSLFNNNYISNAGHLDSQGDIHNDGVLENSGFLHIPGAINNQGEIDNHGEIYSYGDVFQNSGTLSNFGTLTQEDDSILNSGSIVNSGLVVLNGTLDNSFGDFSNLGKLAGFGKFVGSLLDDGIVSPGVSAESSAIFSVDGDWTKSDGTLEIDLGGTFDGGGDDEATDFDWIVVDGDLALAGDLDVRLLDGFTLAESMSFEVIDVGGQLTGTFEGLSEGGFVGNFGTANLRVSYVGGDGNDVVLYAVPTPEPTAALFLCGSGVLACLRRRRQTQPA